MPYINDLFMQSKKFFAERRNQWRENQRLKRERHKEEVALLKETRQKKEEERQRKLQEEQQRIRRSAFKASLIVAAQTDQPDELDRLLDAHRDIDFDLLEVGDQQGNTVFHYAAAFGNRKVFYRFLKLLKAKKPHLFASEFAKIINNKKQTPWHLAAFYARADFFDVEKVDPDCRSEWILLNKTWFNETDDEGNTVLHAAGMVRQTQNIQALLAQLKAKKNIIAKLRKIPGINLNATNNLGKTALHIVSANGGYALSKELLKAREITFDKENKINIVNKNEFKPDKAERKPGDIASALGHQRIERAIDTYARQKVSGDAGANIAFSKASLKENAVNLNMEDDNFMARIKSFINELTQEEIYELIQMRYNAIHKRNRRRAIIASLAGSFCPAISLGGSIAWFGGAYAPFITAAGFLVAYPMLVYGTYRAGMSEDQLKAEVLYLSCAAAKIQSLESKLLTLSAKVTALEKVDVQSFNSNESFKQHEKQIQALKTERTKVQSEMTKFYEPAQGKKKPKLALKFISRKEFEKKKLLAINDPKENVQLATRAQKIRSFLAHKGMTLCTTGALFNIGSVIGTALLTKFAYVGVISAVAGFVGGPIGLGVVATLATLVIAACTAYAIYQSVHKRSNEEAGAKNRSLVEAHDRCRVTDVIEMQELNQDLDRRFGKLDDQLQQQRQELKTPPPSPKILRIPPPNPEAPNDSKEEAKRDNKGDQVSGTRSSQDGFFSGGNAIPQNSTQMPEIRPSNQVVNFIP